MFLLVVAFMAGFVTVVSPCVLPILPIVLASGAGDDRRRPYLVIAGLIASFSFFTLTSVQIVRALHLPDSMLRNIAIVVIAIFGLTLFVPALMARYERLTWRLPQAGAKLARSGSARLYHLVHPSAPARATVTITFGDSGIQAYAFTFGS